MKASDAVSMIEAAYQFELPPAQWLELIAASASRTFGSSQGAIAFQYDASAGDWIQIQAVGLHGLAPDFARNFLNPPSMPSEAVASVVRTFLSVRFGSTRDLFRALGASSLMDPIYDGHGIEDLIGVNGLDPSGRGCMLTIAGPRKTYPARTIGTWHRLASHISAGGRLRAAVEGFTKSGVDPANQAEAILAPNGNVEHAVGRAKHPAARDALRDALVRIDKARSVPDDAHRAVDLWRGLVAGRWSLVEHFERGGRRYYLAHKNDPDLAADRALTMPERQVLGYAELGHSNKLIGYELGLSTTTVSTILGRARKKLGGPQR